MEMLFDADLVALESINPGKDTYYDGMLGCRTLPIKENFPRQRPALWFLTDFCSPVQCRCYSDMCSHGKCVPLIHFPSDCCSPLSFPPRGVTGTFCYRFEYDLHLIKIKCCSWCSLLENNQNIRSCSSVTQCSKFTIAVISLIPWHSWRRYSMPGSQWRCQARAW